MSSKHAKHSLKSLRLSGGIIRISAAFVLFFELALIFASSVFVSQTLLKKLCCYNQTDANGISITTKITAEKSVSLEHSGETLH